jgi:hypothetical protein
MDDLLRRQACLTGVQLSEAYVKLVCIPLETCARNDVMVRTAPMSTHNTANVGLHVHTIHLPFWQSAN